VVAVGDCFAQLDHRQPAVAGVRPKPIEVEGVAVVPAEATGQADGDLVDEGVAVAGVEDQLLDIALQGQHAVQVRFDVVVERIGHGDLVCQADEVHPLGRAEAVGFEHAVGKAERGALQCVLGQAQVAGAEAG
jgi:hypothetical protein